MASPTGSPPRPRPKRVRRPSSVVVAVNAPKVVEEEAAVGPNYALRLTEALDAISAAQASSAPDPELSPPAEMAFAEVLEQISSDNDNRPAHRGMRPIAAPAVVPPELAADDQPVPATATPAPTGFRPPATATPAPTGFRPPAAAAPVPTGFRPRRAVRSAAAPTRHAAQQAVAAANASPLAATVTITRPPARPPAPEPEPEVEVEGDRGSSDLDEDLDGPRPGFLSRVFKSLDTLPAIRLPIGPPIPWRYGLPVLIVLVLTTLMFGRSWTTSDSLTALPSVQATPLPTPTQPLFSNPQPAPVDVSQPNPASTPLAQAAPTVAPPAQSLAAQDPPAAGFDVLDIGLKLIAVLALIYASLLLLKRAGIGTGGQFKTRTTASAPRLRVVGSLALAPNRSVHVLRVPGGKTLVVGATPTQVNLIADLGELPDDQDPAADGSFFDVLKGKLAP